MNIEFNKNLQTLNTLCIPSVASEYIKITHLNHLLDAVTWAKSINKKVFVLGGGSNVIPAQKINGLVLQPKLTGIDVTVQKNDGVLVTIGAGENWHSVVNYCTERGYFGLQNLALIPGDIGAAPIQNIGAYGVELKDIFQQLEALSLNTGKLETFNFNDCEFGYRDSVFKNGKREQYIIVSVTLRLSKTPNVNIAYPALRGYLEENLDKQRITSATPHDVMKAVVAIRQSKLPDPIDTPNAGSFFKNPIVKMEQYHTLLSAFPDIPAYDVDTSHKKLAAAWLIEQAGWKGKGKDGVVVHRDHALVVTNPKRLPIEPILNLVHDIHRDVLGKFAVELELEPRVLG